jgi:pseudouridine-5'-monophosphatase
VATSSKAEAFVRKTAKLGQLFSKFRHVITSSHPSVKQGKPGPDIFRVAAAAFLSDAPPDDVDALEAVMAKPSFDAHCRKCLVFEDSPSGIEAAHSAGMQSVMIPDFPQNFEPDATLKATQVSYHSHPLWSHASPD